MSKVTFLWDEDDYEESFDLIAIHCSEEIYKLAYLLNHHTNWNFSRCKNDLDLTQKNELVYFPIFSYLDNNQVNYYLIQNKTYSQPQKNEQKKDLSTLFLKELNIYYLLPQFKTVDYLLKIEHENQNFPLKRLISIINEIKQVVSVYSIEITNLKSKENLIFDLC